MTQPMLYPLLLAPTLHVKVWGGRKLATLLNKALPTDEPYGESWELHDDCIVLNGALEGQTLGAVLAQYGTELVGTHNNPTDGFPLLAKFLDANDWLSVQVHPNDEQAHALENFPRGKTEAWFMVATDEGAQLVIGIQPHHSRESIAQAIQDGTLESMLVFQTVTRHDIFEMTANTVHALGPGNLIYEIQQNCDLTYRLFDWNRLGLDGKPRQMHIEKGVQVANVDFVPAIKHFDEAGAGVSTSLINMPYFETVYHKLEDSTVMLDTNGQIFHALTCIAGTAHLTSEHAQPLTLPFGGTVLVPSCVGAFSLSGTAAVLDSFQIV
ncbi:MAG: type I phosphomannose isomerase catalytic subunit [Phototrophicaceae bacterium]